MLLCSHTQEANPSSNVRWQRHGVANKPGAAADLKQCRLSIVVGVGGSEGTHRCVKFADPNMADKLSMVAADTLRLMLIIFEVLGDSIVGMSRPAEPSAEETAAAAAKKQAAARPASAPVRGSSKKKGKKQKQRQQNQQVEVLGAVERAELAESKRLEKVKALQSRFVELHVAEKTRSRKEYLLGLCKQPN